MIDVKVIASGSDGNCTVLTSGSTTILLDAGIKFSVIQQALGFKNPTAVLITHEHIDHAQKSTVKEMLKRGVEVLMTRGTAKALKLEPRHNLYYCAKETTAIIGDCLVSCEPVDHDAAEPVCFTAYDGDDVLAYITDTGWLEYDGRQVTKLLVETNYASDVLLSSTINERLKRRIFDNHLGVEAVTGYFETVELPKLKEVWLMHISKRHGDGEEFKRKVQAVVPKGVEVHVAI